VPNATLKIYPLVGLRRPSCADVTGIVRLHPLARSGCLARSGVAGPSAYCEADASPIHRN
jgi:hypothetical protein